MNLRINHSIPYVEYVAGATSSQGHMQVAEARWRPKWREQLAQVKAMNSMWMDNWNDNSYSKKWGKRFSLLRGLQVVFRALRGLHVANVQHDTYRHYDNRTHASEIILNNYTCAIIEFISCGNSNKTLSFYNNKLLIYFSPLNMQCRG